MLTGAFTDCCVLNAAFDASNLGYRVVVPQDLVAGLNADMEDAALKMMSLYCGLAGKRGPSKSLVVATRGWTEVRRLSRDTIRHLQLIGPYRSSPVQHNSTPGPGPPIRARFSRVRRAAPEMKLGAGSGMTPL